MSLRAWDSLMPAHLRGHPVRLQNSATMRSDSSVSTAINKIKEEPKKDAQSAMKPTKCHTTYISCTCGHRVQLPRRIHVSPCKERFSADECEYMTSEQAVIHGWMNCMECRKLPEGVLEKSTTSEIIAEKGLGDKPSGRKPTINQPIAKTPSTYKASKSIIDVDEDDWEEVGEPTSKSRSEGEEDWIVA